MPEAFNKCQKGGGKIRTKKLKGGKYIHIWIPKGGGSSVAGEVKKAKDTHSPHGRVYRGGDKDWWLLIRQ